LLHQWTFEGTTDDAVGNADGQLFNGAQIVNGRLMLDGIDDYLRTDTIDQSISTRTAIVWASLDNLTQRGGGLLTLENPTGSDVFDSIDLGERVARQWMNGSDLFQRSVSNNGGALETLTEPGEVMLAIVYGPGNTITIYRNGVQYNTQSATQGSLVNYPAGVADVLIGLRLADLIGSTGTRTGTDGYFAGAIEEARLYGGVLTAQDIQSLYQHGPVSSQNNLPPGWSVNARPAEFYPGPMSFNPFLDGGTSTPTIPNLHGGADAYGLLPFSADQLLSADSGGVLASAPPDAIAALIRVDSPPAELTTDLAGYDLLLYVNLSIGPLAQPAWSAGGGPVQPLLAGGLANNPLFNGGGNTLGALQPGQIYAMLIREDTEGFSLAASIDVWDFAATLSTLADGDVAYFSVDRAGRPLPTAVDDVSGAEYIYAADPDQAAVRVFEPAPNASFAELATLPDVAGPTSVVIDSAHRFVYATQASDNELVVLERSGAAYATIQTLQNGVAGVRGLTGANTAALSPAPDELFLYVTAGQGDSLTAFRRDPTSGLLDFVQQMSNGNSTTLGLREPNSVFVDESTGIVLVGSSSGVGLNSGGVATFLDTSTSGAALNDGFSLTFEGPAPDSLARLTIETGEQADRIVQVNSANVLLTEIFTGDGDDFVDLAAIAGQTTVETGIGLDTVELRSARADSDVIVDTGDDADTIVVRRNGPNNSMALIAGDGNDLIQVAGHQLGSDVSIAGGDPTVAPGDTLYFESGDNPTMHENQEVQVSGAGIVG
jgi:hypothetical protein